MFQSTAPAKPSSQPAPALRGLSIVAGEAVAQPSGAQGPASVFQATAPATGAEIEPRFFAASDTDVDLAARKAWEAFHAVLDRSSADRAGLLDAMAAEIAGLGDALIDRACEETGLSPPRVVAERERTIYTLRMFAGVVRAGEWLEATIDVGEASRRPLPKPDIRRMLRPLGPAAVFGASNFPLAYGAAGGDTASAIGAGCPVVVKGHPAHPGTGELIAGALTRAVDRAGFHPGTFSYLHSGGMREREVGQRLIQHPCIRAAGFTGSLAGGTALAALAQARPDPIPVFAEMGSTNPVFILPGALESRGAEIAERLVSSMCNSNGQMCTSPGLIFVARQGEMETFARTLGAQIDQARPQPMLSGRTRMNFASRLAEVGRTHGVEIRAGAMPAGEGSGPISSGPVLLRTSFEMFRTEPNLHEEIFGPGTIMVVCESEGQLTEAAASIQGSLTGTIWLGAPDGALAKRLLAILEQRVGRVIFNGVPTGVEVCPAMVHGGPFPATNQPHTTAVGPAAIRRWARPVCFQHAPEVFLPSELRNANPLGIPRIVDGARTTGPIDPAGHG